MKPETLAKINQKIRTLRAVNNQIWEIAAQGRPVDAHQVSRSGDNLRDALDALELILKDEEPKKEE